MRKYVFELYKLVRYNYRDKLEPETFGYENKSYFAVKAVNNNDADQTTDMQADFNCSHMAFIVKSHIFSQTLKNHFDSKSIFSQTCQ